MKKRKFGFTLSEALITLAIIGVVSAMTLPSLNKIYQKHKVETSLKLFYSTINQALRASSVDNGDVHSWITKNKKYTDNETLIFLETYILPYIKYSRVIKHCDTHKWGGTVCVEMSNGSGFNILIDANGPDILYYVDFQNRKNKKFQRNRFFFEFEKLTGHNQTVRYESTLEPYIFGWSGKKEDLYKSTQFGCNSKTMYQYCTKIIKDNNWKIPKEYPW